MRLVKDSLFINLYLRFLDFLGKGTGESAIFCRLSQGFNESAIINSGFLSRVSALWSQSKVHAFVCAILDIPFSIMRLIRRVIPRTIDNSGLLSLIKPKYMPLAFGVCTSILYLVPHNQFNNFYSLVIMAVFLFVFMLCILAGHYNDFSVKRVGFFYLVFGIMVLYSYMRSPSLGLRSLFFYLTAFLAILIIQGVIDSRRALYTLIYALLAVVTVSGIYGCYQRVVGVPIVSAQVDFYVNVNMPGRVYSFFENPNNFAEILVMTLPLYAAMFFISKSTKEKLIIFICALPPAVSMLLTLSRSGWGALVTAILIFFLLANPKVVPAIVLAGAGALPFLPSSIINRALTVFRGGDSSTQFRQTIRDTLEPILQKYWVEGTGLGTETVRMAIRDHYTVSIMPTWAIPAHSHSIYLQTLIEMGIFGALAAGVLLLVFFISCIKGIIKSPRDRFIIAAGVGSIAGMLVMGFVEHIWFYPRVMLMFWIIIGISLAAVRLGRDTTNT